MSLALQLPFPESQLQFQFYGKLGEVFHLLSQLLVPLDVFLRRFCSDKEKECSSASVTSRDNLLTTLQLLRKV